MARRLVIPCLVLGYVACIEEPGSGNETTATPVDSSITVKALAGKLTQGDRPLAVGDTVVLDDTFWLVSGSAELELGGVGSLRLYPKTKLNIVGKRQTRLLAGKLWALIAKAGGERYTIETDTAVCGVRGTRFLVEDAAGRTRVAVAEGRVAVANRQHPSKEVVLGAGEQVEVKGETPPAAKEKFDPAPEDKAWIESATPSGTVQPVSPAAPRPAVRSDREAFERVEKKGRQQKERLKQEVEAEKKQIDEEERRQRKSIEKDQKSRERELDQEMGQKGSMKPKKGSLRHRSIRDEKPDNEMEEFLE